MATLRQVLPRLTAAIQAAAPGADVDIGDFGTRSTWVLKPPPGATAQQIAAAQAVIDAFDTSDAAQEAWEEAQNQERTDFKAQALQAFSNNQDYLATADAATQAQVRQQVKALTQQVNAMGKYLYRIAE